MQQKSSSIFLIYRVFHHLELTRLTPITFTKFSTSCLNTNQQCFEHQIDATAKKAKEETVLASSVFFVTDWELQSSILHVWYLFMSQAYSL